MLKRIAAAIFLIAAGCVPLVHAKTSGKSAASRLASSVDRINSVSFYFVSRTGNYSLRGDRFKDQSTTRIYRNCGNNCRSFMGEVISHLEKSTLTECRPGQQNVLIEIGKVTVLYSYSGRIVEFEGKCYFNEKGIDNTIKSAEFLFK